MKSVSSINIKEQKKVEEGLKLLSQYAQDAIIQMDSDGLVTYWNKSAERLFGYTEKEMIGKNLHSIIVPERYHKAHKIGFSKFKKSGQGAAINKTLELEGIRKDGVEFPVELSLSAVRVKGEWNSIGIIRDITKRKKIEKKLRDSEEKLQTFFDNINDAIYILDLKGNFIDVNATACKRLGYEKREFLQMHIRDINAPELIVENPQLIDEKLWLKKEIVETEHTTKSGKKIPVEIYGKQSLYQSEPVIIAVSRDITRRRIAEKQLKESENKYKILSNELELILDNIPALIFYKDTKNNYIRVNKYIANAHNMKKEELIGKNLSELYSKEQAQAYWNDDLEVINSGKPKLNIEEPWETKDGLRWAFTSKIPLIDENRHVTGIIGTSIDITERKNAEEKLRKSLETTKTILDLLPIGIILVGYDKKVRSVNKAALDLLEIDDELEILGKLCHNVMCVAEIGACPIFDMGQKIDQSERFLINRFGKEIPILKSVLPITLGDNNYLLESFVDVSSLKETQEKLKESQEKYRDLLDTSSLGILDINVVKGEVEYLNPKLSELLGYSKEELLANNLFNKIMFREDIRKLFNSRDDEKLEYVIKTKDGKRKWLKCTKLSQYNKKGELIKLSLWMQDISERKKGESLKRIFTEKLEKEVESRTKDLTELIEKQKLYLDQIEKSSRFKTEFMATMSHELRTPLNAIIGFTDLLLESVFGELNEEQLEFVKDIDESSNHLLEMITDILDISKIEAGQVVLTVEEIHLNNLVNQVISTLKPLYNEKELIIELKGLKKEQLIFADRIKFKQIIYNLLSNAIKFTEKGKVTFEFRESKDIWEFNVKDTGIGIAEKDFEIIFKDFMRVKSAYVDSILGSGLGLALSKRIVNLHGGDIVFTSKLGKGTTFTFTIPKNLRNKVNIVKKVESFLSKL